MTDELPRRRRQRFAECKNEADKADTEHIDAVVGKAKDVGFPSQDVIYVTTNGYTEDALKRANAEGIKTLVLRGLSKDRLAPALIPARQILVYVQLSIIEVNLTSFLADPLQAMGMSPLGVSRSSPFVTILNGVYQRWTDGTIPDTLGVSELAIPLRGRLLYVSETKETEIPAAKVKFQVFAHVVSVPGDAVKLELVEASEGRLEKVTVKSRFAHDETKVVASSVETEEHLATIVKPDVPVQLVLGRQRLPRINCLNRFYWPVSAQSQQRLRQLQQLGVDPTTINVQMTEGLTIQAFFEAPPADLPF